MLKLYKATVTMEVEIVIAAESEPDEDDFVEAFRDELRENGYLHEDATDIGRIALIDEAVKLPTEWERAIPYGDAEDRTCLQILDEYRPEQPPFGEQQEILGANDGRR